MIGRTHDLAAITALGIIVLSQPFRTVSLATAIISIFANLVGGVAPDIDQPTAPLWRNLPVGKYFGRIFKTLNGGHRFLTHSVIGLALFTLAVHWLLIALHPVMHTVDVGLVTWAFFIGMVSHLVMDSFTREGVPWLLPIPIKFGFPPLRSMRITTGHFAEKFIVFPLLLIANGFLYSANYAKILEIVRRHLV
jgi:inner membrane protein